MEEDQDPRSIFCTLPSLFPGLQAPNCARLETISMALEEVNEFHPLARAPNLQSLTLSHFSEDIGTCLALDKVKELTVISEYGLIGLLQRCRSVESLHLSIPGSTSVPRHPFPTLTSYSLSSIDCMVDPDSRGRFLELLDAISVPALKRLSLRSLKPLSQYDDLPHHIRAFIRRSACTILDISISNVVLSESSFRTLFDMLSSLERIYLSWLRQDAPVLEWSFLLSETGKPYLPQLREFHVWITDTECVEKSWRSFVHGRPMLRHAMLALLHKEVVGESRPFKLLDLRRLADGTIREESTTMVGEPAPKWIQEILPGTGEYFLSK